MGFFKAIWGAGKGPPAEPISREELVRTFADYDRKLAELNEAMRALKDHEPDHRHDPAPRWNPDAP